jgi:cyclase
VLPTLLAAFLAGFGPGPGPAGFHLVRVAPGVYAGIRSEPSRNVVNGNATIIINDRDVVVVDANGTPAAARATIAAIRRLTRKPVRYLVNTHWHDDHTMGNQAYRDAFPEVQIIGHPRTREAMATIAVANREQYLKGLPGLIQYLRGQLAAGKDLENEPLTPEVRTSLSADVRLAESYLVQAPTFRPVLPNLLVTRSVTLRRGARTIEIRHFGRGNTAGDLVVWLPKERVLITGDLVVYPTPYVFDSYIGDWIAVLDSLKARRAAVIIPGHGPVLRDYRYVDLVERALREVQAEVAADVAKGFPLDSIRTVVTVDSLREDFVGKNRVSRFPWGYSFLSPAIARAYEEATGTRGP